MYNPILLSVRRNKFKIACVLFSAFIAFFTTAGAKPTLPFGLPESLRSLRSSTGYGTTSETFSTYAPFVSIPESFANYVAQKQAQNMKSYR